MTKRSDLVINEHSSDPAAVQHADSEHGNPNRILIELNDAYQLLK
jgi:hypothetical protein